MNSPSLFIIKMMQMNSFSTDFHDFDVKKMLK